MESPIAPLAQLVECPAYTREVEGSRPSGGTTSKLCPSCSEVKALDNFYKSSKSILGVQSWCKPCCLEARKDSYRKNPRGPRTYAKRYNLMSKYGITEEDLAKLQAQQNDCCAICGAVSKLNVDHNHSTGKVRELLCGPCNWGLGQFKDQSGLLRKAADYIDKHL